MGLFKSRTPATPQEVVERMRASLGRQRFRDVIQDRKAVSDAAEEGLQGENRYWLNALPLLAICRWAKSEGVPASSMMEAADGWGWLGAKEYPCTPEQQEAEREIEAALS